MFEFRVEFLLENIQLVVDAVREKLLERIHLLVDTILEPLLEVVHLLSQYRS